MRNQFLRFALACFFMLTSLSAALAAGTVTGTVVDAETGDALVGATVVLVEAKAGTIANEDGSFSLNATAGSYTLQINYVGYVSYEQNVTLRDGETNNLGEVKMTNASVGVSEVEIIASVAIDRKTPVAVSTITGDDVANLVGNQEFPEIIRSTPSIYVTKQGGGFGDSRINVRGFDQRNTAVMINGIPVNDMENGWVYWSNWAGLADVTSTIQVQRGLGASKLAVPSVGGSINIVTNAADFKKGGAVTIGTGNDGYQKYGLMLSTGLGENGWAATAQFTHSRGNGYVDGTKFSAYSYFLSATKRFNSQHSLSMTALGAPQWHHQRLVSRFDNITLQTYLDQGIQWNHLYGDLNGEEFSWRRNFYHKPKIFLNHYWNISDNTSLKTSAYLSFGRGGGTGPRGRISNGDAFFFDSFAGLGQNGHDANGQFRFNDLVAHNSGQGAEGFGTKEADADFNNQFTTTSRGDGIIRRASMNSHNWYGILSNLNTQLNDKLNLVVGFDGRYYLGEHYRRVENLLGNDAYLSRSDDNNPTNYITEESPAEFLNFADNSYRTSNNVLNYRNDGIVTWLGLYTQLEYSTDDLTAFVSLSGSNQGFQRIDYFNYSPDDNPENDIDNDGEYQTSPRVNKLGGTIKAGLNYNINSRMNIFVNGGLFSRQPIFDNVFLNFRNDINDNLVNQSVYAVEAGYGYRTGDFNFKANVYHTQWGNRQFDQTFDVQINDTTVVEGLANFSGVAQLHQGLELEASYRPLYNFTITGMASINNWRYTDNFVANIIDLQTNQSLGNATIFADGLKIGDAAQTTFNIRGTYEFAKGFKVYANYYRAGNLYSQFDITDDQFLMEGGQVLKLPSYGLTDAGLIFNFKLGDDVKLRWNLNVNNILDVVYVSEVFTNRVDTSAELNGLYTNQGFFGFGRTWNTTLKVIF